MPIETESRHFNSWEDIAKAVNKEVLAIQMSGVEGITMHLKCKNINEVSVRDLFTSGISEDISKIDIFHAAQGLVSEMKKDAVMEAKDADKIKYVG